jgi:hypothetical protein
VIGLKRSERNVKQGVIIDMNDFLIAYGAQKLGKRSDLAEVIYNAAKQDLKGLDDLFKDNGNARQQVFEAVGEGFIADYFGDDDPDQRQKRADELTQEAISYLGAHLRDFDDWENN